MGRRGRKPAPTALKILKGVHACRRNDNEPAVPAGKPARPAKLTRRQAKHWRELVALLEAMQVLTRADGPALALYIQAYELAATARDDWQERGITVINPSGAHVQNPSVRTEHAATAHMIRLLCEFGLTPSARSQLTAARPAGDELEQFLERKKG